MLDNIIQKHDNKIHNNAQKTKFRKINTAASTRVPVLCNTARVVTYPENNEEVVENVAVGSCLKLATSWLTLWRAPWWKP